LDPIATKALEKNSANPTFALALAGLPEARRHLLPS